MHTSLKRGALVGAVVLVGSLALAPSPGSADPAPAHNTPLGQLTISQAQAKVDALNHQAEIASEQMNTLKVEIGNTHDKLKALQSDLRRQSTQVQALRAQLIGHAMAAYQNGGGLSTDTSFLVAKDPKTFLTGLANTAVTENQQAGLLTRLTQQQKQLSLQQQQAKAELKSISDDKAAIAKQQQTIRSKTAQVQSILNTLTAAQQHTVLAAGESSAVSRSQPRVPTHDVPASQRAEVAVSTALAQVGKPYVYGAAGPDAFDCSGLTMYSWAAAGVSLPHSAAAQSGYGTPVSLSSLSPGDLVFYYSPISHVAMYIGHGEVVHAPYPGRTVEVVSMYEMPVAMAVHIG